MLQGPQRCQGWNRRTWETRSQGKICSVLVKNPCLLTQSRVLLVIRNVKNIEVNHYSLKTALIIFKNIKFPPCNTLPQKKIMHDLHVKKEFLALLRRALFVPLYFKRKWYKPVCNASASFSCKENDLFEMMFKHSYPLSVMCLCPI